MQFTFASLCLLASAVIVKAQGPQGYASLNGGTTGGAGGATVNVATYAELVAALAGDAPKTVIVTGVISQKAKVVIGSNKTLKGANGAQLIGTGLSIKNVKNVIIQNLRISKVQASEGDAIGIQKATNIWVDHCDLSSDLTSGKDFYDGLLDITHAGDFITVSYNKFHDHFKASLVGHSDNNAAEDTGKLRVTYHNNYWLNINSRAPSLRFGTGHIYNNLFENVKTAINTRQKAQVLVENNVFVNSPKSIYSTDGGFAVQKNNDFGANGANTALAGTLNTAPYTAVLQTAADVKGLARTAGVQTAVKF